MILAITPPDNGRANGPLYFSDDGGETWSLKFDVPLGIRGDQTVSFATTSNSLYMAALRRESAILDVIRFVDPTTEGSRLVVLDTRDKIDQPWVQAISVVGGPDNGKDRIYIGYNDSSNSALHPIATIDFCLDALADQPIFTQVQLERRKAPTTPLQFNRVLKTATRSLSR